MSAVLLFAWVTCAVLAAYCLGRNFLLNHRDGPDCFDHLDEAGTWLVRGIAFVALMWVAWLGMVMT